MLTVIYRDTKFDTWVRQHYEGEGRNTFTQSTFMDVGGARQLNAGGHVYLAGVNM